MKPLLQNRWQIENSHVVYYGLRRKPYTFNKKMKLSQKEVEMIQSMDGEKDLSTFTVTPKLRKMIEQGILVDKYNYRRMRESLDEAVFCKKCAANDFILPGIEFDEEGLCPICSHQEELKDIISVIPYRQTLPKAKASRFDAAVFYTGGKDSSYLLYYLSKICGLRIAALTWEIPFMSSQAKESIDKAKEHLPHVEFINRRVNTEDLSTIYKKLYELQQNTCACPSLAYILFYPLLVEENIPYLVLGNEPAQVKALLFNEMAPLFTYKLANSRWFHYLVNTGRILTLHRPLRAGQFHMLMTVKQLAYGDHWIKKSLGYDNKLLSNVCKAIHEAPTLLKPLRKAIKRSNWEGSIPALIHIDFNQISPSGVYDWKKIKETLKEEMGWVDAPEACKGLHTSCCVEKGKEYSQFMNFRSMKSSIMPFSALEIALAVSMGCLSKEEALKEFQNNSGFTLERPKDMDLMEIAFDNKADRDFL